MVTDDGGNIFVIGESKRPVGIYVGFGSRPVQTIQGSAVFVAKLVSGEIDLDHDGVYNILDSCPSGYSGWTSANSNDYDGDGCFDATEDDDDDDDSIADSLDNCQFSSYRGSYAWLGTRLIWTSGSGIHAAYDHDSDGCHDLYEDTDDDNDGVFDLPDLCEKGSLNWTSNQTTDYDNDGCLDSGEDQDDDNDGVYDLIDLCPKGVSNFLNTTNGNFTDHDRDGCEDLLEDLDDDNDGFNDTIDLWPHDIEAYGADTDGDGLPDDIFLTETSFIVNRSTLNHLNSSIDFGHRDNVSLRSMKDWQIPNTDANMYSPLFVPMHNGPGVFSVT